MIVDQKRLANWAASLKREGSELGDALHLYAEAWAAEVKAVKEERDSLLAERGTALELMVRIEEQMSAVKRERDFLRLTVAARDDMISGIHNRIEKLESEQCAACRATRRGDG
ncbi:MAG: hypothetical protein ACYCOU_01310 [Sulfobacillus sp.]